MGSWEALQLRRRLSLCRGQKEFFYPCSPLGGGFEGRKNHPARTPQRARNAFLNSHCNGCCSRVRHELAQSFFSLFLTPISLLLFEGLIQCTLLSFIVSHKTMTPLPHCLPHLLCFSPFYKPQLHASSGKREWGSHLLCFQCSVLLPLLSATITALPTHNRALPISNSANNNNNPPWQWIHPQCITWQSPMPSTPSRSASNFQQS